MRGRISQRCGFRKSTNEWILPLRNPPCSHSEDPERSSSGSGRGRGKVIILKYSQSVLHSKCLMYQGKNFKEPYSSWQKGILTPTPSNLPVSPKASAGRSCTTTETLVKRQLPRKTLRLNQKIIKCFISLTPYHHTNRTYRKFIVLNKYIEKEKNQS